MPKLDLTVQAVGLTAEEATVCAAILDVTQDATNQSPSTDVTASGWHAMVDDAGALRPEHTRPRPEGEAGAGSLLPHATLQYADQAATTLADVEVLAPVTPAKARTRVESADPQLDRDLTTWLDPDCPVPRLWLLGPVKVRGRGPVKAVAKRRPYHTELFAFLALRPRGAATEEISEAIGITPHRVRVDLTALRAWLGTNPRTSLPFLPDARRTRAAHARGVPTYQLEDVLVDVDLFRRLRARGQARGATGQKDLLTALSLVKGQPFSDLREGGWNWLLEGDRIDEVMTSAIVDVAHLVTTAALVEGDHEIAMRAARIAVEAAPYDDIALLDLERATHLGDTSDESSSRPATRFPRPRRPHDGPRTNLRFAGTPWNRSTRRERCAPSAAGIKPSCGAFERSRNRVAYSISYLRAPSEPSGKPQEENAL